MINCIHILKIKDTDAVKGTKVSDPGLPKLATASSDSVNLFCATFSELIELDRKSISCRKRRQWHFRQDIKFT